MARAFQMGADQVRRLLPRDAAAMLGIGVEEPAAAAATQGTSGTPDWLRAGLEATAAGNVPDPRSEPAGVAEERLRDVDVDPREQRATDEERAAARAAVEAMMRGAR